MSQPKPSKTTFVIYAIISEVISYLKYALVVVVLTYLIMGQGYILPTILFTVIVHIFNFVRFDLIEFYSKRFRELE